VDLLSYIPLLVGGGCAIVAIQIARRRGARSLRLYSFLMVAAMLLAAGSAVTALIRAALDGAPFLFVPVALLVVLAILVAVHLLGALSANRDEREPDPAAQRAVSRRVTAIVAIVLALLAVTVGWIASMVAAAVFPDDPVAATAVVIGVLALGAIVFVPQLALGRVIRLRQSTSEERAPVSAEVADAIYHSGLAAAMRAFEIRRASTRLLLLVAAAGLALATVALMPLWVPMLAGGQPATIAPWLRGTIAVAIAGLLLVAGGYTLVAPAVLDQISRYRWSGLSEAELSAVRRRRVRQAFPGARFPAALEGTGRVLPMLTISPSKLVSLEVVPLASLVDAAAAPLDEYVEAFSIGADKRLPSIDDMDDEEGVVVILKIARACVEAHSAGQRFDAFLEDDETLRVVAVGADDYEEFPSSLAHEIARSL
jgi:hypothetical protein